MNLYPSDLGEWTSLQVQGERIHAQTEPDEGMRPNTVGVWALACSALAAFFWAIHVIPLLVMMGPLAVLCLAWYAYLALRALDADESRQRPLTVHELKSVWDKAEGALFFSYLDLAVSVVNLPATKDATADREVREAITALGTAIEALPPEQKVVTDDPVALRRESVNLSFHAQSEPDALIGASLRRRAEALALRADTAARTALLLRRNRALRQEVGEQIKALQTSLTALQIGGRQSAPQLSGLAASIQRVALEANAVTTARDEVDTVLSLSVAPVSDQAETEVRVRISQ